MQQKKSLCPILLMGILVCLVLVAGINSNFVNAQAEKFKAKLKGESEIPPVTSEASGKVKFKVKDDVLTSKINVTGITDVTGANIYSGSETETGEPIVDLLKSSKQENTSDRIIIQGEISATDLQGSMSGKSLADLQSAMATEGTYVNILTAEHPDGEIRGQIKVSGNQTQPVTMGTTATETEEE